MKIDSHQAENLPCVPCQSAKSSKPEPPPNAAASVMTVDPSKVDWIGIELKNRKGEPVPRERFSVRLADGREIGGRLDNLGKIRLEGIAPGSCTVTFPDRDAREWRKS